MADSGTAISPALGEAIRRTARVAKSLAAANGLVVYTIAPDCRLGELLFAEEDERRCAAYFSGHFRDDPLAPEKCLRSRTGIVCLHQQLAAGGDRRGADSRYYEEFMRPYGLGDAAEMFLAGSGELPMLGFSLLRNAARPCYSAAELDVLADFHDLAEQLLGRLAAAPIADSRQHLQRRFPGLTARELDVAAGIADGLSNKLLARREAMALSTVKTHLQSIYRKCGVASRSGLARLAC